MCVCMRVCYVWCVVGSPLSPPARLWLLTSSRVLSLSVSLSFELIHTVHTYRTVPYPIPILSYLGSPGRPGDVAPRSVSRALGRRIGAAAHRIVWLAGLGGLLQRKPDSARTLFSMSVSTRLLSSSLARPLQAGWVGHGWNGME